MHEGTCFHLASRGSLCHHPAAQGAFSDQGLLAAMLCRAMRNGVEGCPQDFIVPGIRTLSSPTGVSSAHIDKDSFGSFWEVGCLPLEKNGPCSHGQSTLWKCTHLRAKVIPLLLSSHHTWSDHNRPLRESKVTSSFQTFFLKCIQL